MEGHMPFERPAKKLRPDASGFWTAEFHLVPYICGDKERNSCLERIVSQLLNVFPAFKKSEMSCSCSI